MFDSLHNVIRACADAMTSSLTVAPGFRGEHLHTGNDALADEQVDQQVRDDGEEHDALNRYKLLA